MLESSQKIEKSNEIKASEFLSLGEIKVKIAKSGRKEALSKIRPHSRQDFPPPQEIQTLRRTSSNILKSFLLLTNCLKKISEISL